MKKPTISAVIDSYNSAAFIGEAIESVLSQTHQPDEIIVADASTDGSRDIIGSLAAKDSRIKTIFTENRGQLSTILAGTDAASGDWIFLLDGDDAYKADHIEKRVRRIKDFEDADILYGRHTFVGEEKLINVVRARDNDENPAWLGPIDLEKTYDWGSGTALAWCLPSYHVGGVTATISIRREHLETLPLRKLCEDTGYRLQANADYMILLASALYNGRKVYTPERTVNYRLHQSSISGSHAAGHHKSLYIQRYYCLLARQWLCALPQFGPLLHELLDVESKTVPDISEGHRAMYAYAKKSHPRAKEELLASQIVSMEKSLSWKLTAPLRALGRVFGIG